MTQHATDPLQFRLVRGLLRSGRKPADAVKVVDFGLVKAFGTNESTHDSSAATIGTPLYLAPEPMTSPETVDGRADLYALGGVAYFLLTGKPVFEAATVVEMCSRHLLEQPLPLSARLGKVVSADLEALVLACLAKDREARPVSAVSLRAALRRCEEFGGSLGRVHRQR